MVNPHSFASLKPPSTKIPPGELMFPGVEASENIMQLGLFGF